MALPDLDNTSTPVSVALEQIEAQDRAWIRALAVRSDGNWAARVVEIVTGAPPPAWEEVDWTYTEAWLLAIERPGGEVRAMLQAGVLRCDDREIAASVSDGHGALDLASERGELRPVPPSMALLDGAADLDDSAERAAGTADCRWRAVVGVVRRELRVRLLRGS